MLVALSCAAPAASDDFRSAPLPVAFDERLDVLLEERGVYGEVHRIETEAAYVYEKLGARYGKRLQLPRSPEALVNAWPALFGEPFEERREHAAVVVVLHCFSDARRAAALQRWRHAHLKRTRHLFASDRLDVGAGFLGFPDDDGKQGVDFTTTGGKYLGAHRPLLALMFANDTWGGAFDWLAHGDDDTRFELSRLGAYLGARDAALPLFVGMPGHRHYPCKPAAGPLRAADPFACCVDDSQPCRVDVPPSKPYFSFELNRSDTRTIGPGVGGGPGDGTVVVTPCRRRGKRKPCCPVRQRHDDSPFPYRYHPTRGRVHYHNLASWAYGGIGYYVSRGLLAEITRHEWQACADKLVCGNADQRVSTCLFNHGFQLSRVAEPRAFAIHGAPVLDAPPGAVLFRGAG